MGNGERSLDHPGEPSVITRVFTGETGRQGVRGWDVTMEAEVEVM